MKAKEMFEGDIRHLKLQMILGETPNLEPDIKRIKRGDNWILNKPYWKWIEKWKGESVITGSLSLHAFGLLERTPTDLDFLVRKVPDGITLYQNIYIGMEAEVDLLGYFPDRSANMNIDFFQLKESDQIIEKDGYLFHHPYQIMECKMRISEKRWNDSKDFWDIHSCLKKLIPNYQDPFARK